MVLMDRTLTTPVPSFSSHHRQRKWISTDNDGGRNYGVKVQLKQITIPIPLGSYFATGTHVFVLCTKYSRCTDRYQNKRRINNLLRLITFRITLLLKRNSLLYLLFFRCNWYTNMCVVVPMLPDLIFIFTTRTVHRGMTYGIYMYKSKQLR